MNWLLNQYDSLRKGAAHQVTYVHLKNASLRCYYFYKAIYSLNIIVSLPNICDLCNECDVILPFHEIKYSVASAVLSKLVSMLGVRILASPLESFSKGICLSL